VPRETMERYMKSQGKKPLKRKLKKWLQAVDTLVDDNRSTGFQRRWLLVSLPGLTCSRCF
jgi:hypothetical protein